MIIYYLNTETGDVWDVNSEDNADLSDHPDFVLLNDEQVAFYINCKSEGYVPNAEEIETCTRSIPYTPPPIDLLEYKKTVINRLDQLSLFTAGQLSPSYQRENAKMSLSLMDMEPNAITIYDRVTSEEIIRNANRIGLICKNEFHRVEALILSSENISDVDMAYASHQYNKIISDEQ